MTYSKEYNNNHRETFNLLSLDLQKLFRGYGQDLAMQGAKPGEQRFGTPEVVLAVASVIGFIIGTATKRVVEVIVERLMNERDNNEQLSHLKIIFLRVQSKITYIEKLDYAGAVKLEMLHEQFQEIEHLIIDQELINAMHSNVPRDDLVQLLQKHGFTQRKALSLAAEIIKNLKTYPFLSNMWSE